MIPAKKEESVEAYMAALTPTRRKALERVRKIIHAAAPGATEQISYHIPCFKFKGKVLLYIGASTNHLAIYAIPSGFEKELRDFELSGRGTVRFLPGKPIPAAIIKRIVKARIERISG
jgi:uncharacterized protein YdhG (YjbR/CyaY superfamily)